MQTITLDDIYKYASEEGLRPVIFSDLASRIGAFVKIKGLNTEQLAASLELSETYLINILEGKTTPPADTFFKIIEKLKIVTVLLLPKHT